MRLRGREDFPATQGFLDLPVTEGHPGPPGLGPKALQERRAFRVFRDALAPLESQDPKESLVKPSRRQGLREFQALRAEMVKLASQAILAHPGNLVCPDFLGKRGIQGFLASDAQAHRGQKVFPDCQVSPERREIQEDRV